MSALVILGDTSGSITLQAPAAAGSGTVYTLPAATGTVMVSGNMPAFSAYATSNQTLSGNVVTKILFDTEEFDTNNNFASSRFTPTVAGYYFLLGHIQPNDSYTAGIVAIYKNGGLYKYTSFNQNSTGSAQATGSCLMYMNGSTDYAEFYASFVDGQPTAGSAAFTWFQGYMVRAA